MKPASVGCHTKNVAVVLCDGNDIGTHILELDLTVSMIPMRYGAEF